MENEITLDLREVFMILRKRIKLILAITIACTLISAIVSFFIIKPVYEARTSIIVGKAKLAEGKLDNSDVTMYQKLLKTYAVIAESERVAENAAVKLKLKYTPKQILSMISVMPQQDTQVLEIKAENKNSKEAAAVIDAVTSAFEEEAKVVFSAGGTIGVLDRASVPKSPIKPKRTANVAIGFLLGLMISMAVIFVLEYMDKTIKSEDDVKRYLGLPGIGIIPQQMPEVNKSKTISSKRTMVSKGVEI